MNRSRLLALGAAALGLSGLAACAPATVAEYGVAPPGYVATAPVYAPGYAPAPGYAAGPAYATGPAYAAAPAVDPYCREAYAATAGAQTRAALSGTYEDAARAARAQGFYRRDC